MVYYVNFAWQNDTINFITISSAESFLSVHLHTTISNCLNYQYNFVSVFI